MTDDRDPPRLRRASDSPADLVEALEPSQGELPTAARLEQMSANLDAALAAPGESVTRATPRRASRRRPMRPMAGGGASASFKLLLAATVAAGGLATGLWLFATTRNIEPTRAAPQSPAIALPERHVVPFDVVEAPPQHEADLPRPKDGAAAVRPGLGEEREFIAIQALDASGRHAEAMARAAQFRNQYPTSAHLRRLELLLGTTDAIP